MKITVDDHPVELPDDATVLDGVRAAGANVPTLCHDDRLSPSGACRVCLVRVAGAGVVAACMTPAADGQVIHTDAPDVVAMARRVVELTVERLPRAALDFPTELATVCADVGVDAGAFAPAGRGLGEDNSHPYVQLDRDLCIACGRCVRMCDEVQGTFALTSSGRGADTVVAPGTGGAWIDSACVACGGCVDTCPTGAITQPGVVDVDRRPRRRYERPAATAASAALSTCTSATATSSRSLPRSRRPRQPRSRLRQGPLRVRVRPLAGPA